MIQTLPLQPLAAQGAVQLTEWGLICAKGADAASFLHSQLTQDISQLPQDRARWAGYCSAKGRLLATFLIWRGADDAIYLACSADLLQSTLKRLRMFVLRAKCELVDASALWVVHGLAGEAAASLAPAATMAVHASAGAMAVRLDAQRALLVLPVGQAPAGAAAMDLSAWKWLEVHAAVPRVVAATTELFVPQMVNLELVGGVSFQKGCYPGQEVVARSQYRGSIKRRSHIFHCAAAAQPGQEVYVSTDPEQPAGTVVLAASLNEHAHCALVQVKTEALLQGSLHLGTSQGAELEPLELPYPMPVAD